MNPKNPSFDPARRQFIGSCCAAVGATGMLSTLAQLRLTGALASPDNGPVTPTAAGATKVNHTSRTVGAPPVAARLGVAPGTLKSHVHRMRERWSELLFEIVGSSLDNPTEEDIRNELRELQGYV
jgi:hypothetical protein